MQEPRLGTGVLVKRRLVPLPPDRSGAPRSSGAPYTSHLCPIRAPSSVTARTRIARSHPGVPEQLIPIRTTEQPDPLVHFPHYFSEVMAPELRQRDTPSYRTAKKQRRIFGPLRNAEWYYKERSSARAKPRPGPGLRNKDRAQREELPRDHQRERLQRELPHRTKHIRTRHDRSWNIHVRTAHER